MLSYIQNLGHFILLGFPIAVLLRCVMILQNKLQGKKISFAHEVGCVLFFSCLSGLASQTVFPAFWSGGEYGVLTTVIGGENQNFQIFSTVRQVLGSSAVNLEYLYVQILGVIILFLPVGFFLPWLWKFQRPLIGTLLYGAAGGFGIEVFQFFLFKGADIDDFLCSLIGTLCGYWLFVLLRRISPRIANGFSV